MKTLIIFRGLPGAGKTSLAEHLSALICRPSHYKSGPPVISADDYFMKDGEYIFNRDDLHRAHISCEARVDEAMTNKEQDIFVANTFTKESELKPYMELAEKHGYRVFSIIVENRHGNKSIHNVPDETMNKMQNRFSIKL